MVQKSDKVRIKQMINDLFKAFLDKVGLFDLFGRFLPTATLPIIMYHNIGNPELDWLYEKPLPPSVFELQIKYLKKLGYSMLTLSEALTSVRKGERKRIAVLTFDDGYSGIYKYAFPIMRKYNVRGTVFVSSSFVEEDAIPWWEKVAFITSRLPVPARLNLELFGTIIVNKESDKRSIAQVIIRRLQVKDIDYINLIIEELMNISGIDIPNTFEVPIMIKRDHLKEMVEYGIEIGGHGVHHVSLPKLTQYRLREELYGSLSFVKKYCKSDPMTFAYPFGAFDNRVIKNLKSVGFDAAVTMEPFVNNTKSLDLYRLGRIPPYGSAREIMASFKYNLLIKSFIR